MLKNIKLTKILKVGKFSSYVILLSTLFVSDKTSYCKANIGNSFK